MPSATVELVSRIALAWMDKRPFSKEARERRKALRKARKDGGIMPDKVTVTMPDGSTHEREEPAIPLRTSTKAGIIGALVPLLGVIPFYDQVNTLLLQACQSDKGPTVFLGGAAIAWASMVVTARLSKSPIKPGAL